jgi:hypothetical protein
MMLRNGELFIICNRSAQHQILLLSDQRKGVRQTGCVARMERDCLIGKTRGKAAVGG